PDDKGGRNLQGARRGSALKHGATIEAEDRLGHSTPPRLDICCLVRVGAPDGLNRDRFSIVQSAKLDEAHTDDARRACMPKARPSVASLSSDPPGSATHMIRTFACSVRLHRPPRSPH